MRKRKSISRIYTILLTAWALILISSYSYSQAHETEMHQSHRHHVGLFLGGTSNFKNEETDFSLGLEYEYRLSKKTGGWSIGLIGELIFAHQTEYLLAMPIVLRVSDAFFFRAGPGIEWAQHGEENGHGRETEFFVRFGIGYGFEVDKFSITPTLDFDIFQGHTTLVWGIAIGKGF